MSEEYQRIELITWDSTSAPLVDASEASDIRWRIHPRRDSPGGEPAARVAAGGRYRSTARFTRFATRVLCDGAGR
jgi:hypothetical protein